MNKRWIQITIVVVVALCNANARPKEDDFYVYRSLEPKTDDRYGDSHDNFIPIATVTSSSLSVKSYSNIKANGSLGDKKWPGGQGTINSLDDLLLYHMYTGHVHSQSHNYDPETTTMFPDHLNPVPFHTTKNSYPEHPYSGYYENNYPISQYTPDAPMYIDNSHYAQNYPPSKPSIIIIEDVAPSHQNRPPYYDTSDQNYPSPTPIYSSVLHIADRPRPTTEPTNYVPIILGSTVRPLFVHNEEYPSVQEVTSNPVPQIYPEITTKKPKKKKKKKKKPNKCPNVYINTSSSINNQNDINSKCEDVTINVDSNLSNSNDVKPVHSSNTQVQPLRPARPLIVQEDIPIFQQQTPVFVKPPHHHFHHKPILNHILNKPRPIFLPNNSPLPSLSPTFPQQGVFSDPIQTVRPILSDPTPSTSPPLQTSNSPSQSPVTIFFNFFGGFMNEFMNSLTRFPFASFLTLPIFSAMAGPVAIVLAGGVAVSSIFFPGAFPFFNPFRRRRNRGRNSLGSKITTGGSDSRIRKPEKTLEDIAVVARSSYVSPASPAAVADVANKVAVAVGQMAEDMRTPSKLKEHLKINKTESATTVFTSTTSAATVTTVPPPPIPPIEKVEANGRFGVLSTQSAAPKPAAQQSPESFEGKAASNKKEDIVRGVAVPVIMDDDTESPPKKLQKIASVVKPMKDEKKKVGVTVKPGKEPATTTPSSGLSTWILLSDNREATTPTNAKKKITTTTKKSNKVQTTPATPKAVTKPGKKATAQSDRKSENQPQSALETLVKQKTGSIVTAQKKKPEIEKEKASEQKKVVTIPPAILVKTSTSLKEAETTDATPETTTKKKKTSSKKRKKNKNRKKNPAEKSGADQVLTDLVKQPKQPVGAQFYNFLSREIMPTVGLGLVGVLVTAGLAGLLGYNPFYGTTIPVRRTYESQHGYYPNGNYYSNNYQSEFGEADTGKNEEVLFREVLSGMPEDSRYNMPPAEVSYPESQLYNSQEHAYKAASGASETDKKQETPDASYSSPYDTQYDSYSDQDKIGAKQPVYSGGAYVYPEKSTEKFKASAKYNENEKYEKQPEALYRVSGDYTSGTDADDTSASGTDSDQAWHRIGSPMDQPSHLSYMEPGPRRLDLDKMTAKLTESHNRSKRSPESILARLVRRSNEVAKLNLEDDKENEIDSNDVAGGAEDYATTKKMNEVKVKETTSTEAQQQTTTSAASLTTSSDNQPSLAESFPTEAPPVSAETAPSLMDVLRRLAQFKLRLGINFLKATTDAFGKYLEGVQQRVEDSMANDTTFPAMRYTWLGRDASATDGESKIREKRYQRDAKYGSFVNEDDDLTMDS